MSTTVRNTGTHFRFDDDESLWKVRVRMQVKSDNTLRWDEFVTQVATLLELIAWLQALLDGYAAQADTTVRGL